MTNLRENTKQTSQINADSPENLHIIRDFVSREVFVEVGEMVEYILQKSYEDGSAPFCNEDLDLERFSFIGSFISFENITNVEKKEVIEELKSLVFKLESNESFEVKDDDFCYLKSGIYTEDQVENIQAEMLELEELKAKYLEVLEWWLVSSYLANKLIEKGEVVIESSINHIWGCTTSGQAISLDGVISEICNDLDLLK